MKDFLRKAIETGEAIDCYKNPEKVRAFLEERVGYMRDGFSNSDIEKFITSFINRNREYGVRYFIDMEMQVYKWQMANFPIYLKNIVEKFKNELKK